MKTNFKWYTTTYTSILQEGCIQFNMMMKKISECKKMISFFQLLISIDVDVGKNVILSYPHEYI